MSKANEFWQYANEAVLSGSYASDDEERQGLLDLARTWTQAGLIERRAQVKALASVHHAAQAPIIRETMALRILKVAYQGGRDPERCAMPRLVTLAHGCRPPSVSGSCCTSEIVELG
jgi:hypothetical protein